MSEITPQDLREAIDCHYKSLVSDYTAHYHPEKAREMLETNSKALAAFDAMAEKASKGELFEKLEWLYVSGDWTKTVRPGAKTLREFAEALKAELEPKPSDLTLCYSCDGFGKFKKAVVNKEMTYYECIECNGTGKKVPESPP